MLNEHFVCIKVDREERPDLDQIYMNAVQMLTGRGGWPMSVFLTPDLQAVLRRHVLAADERGGGMPGFDQMLPAVLDAWTTSPRAGRSSRPPTADRPTCSKVGVGGRRERRRACRPI